MIPVGLIAGAALGAGQMLYGAAQKRKADAAAKANVMPEYKIPHTEQQALALEESRAGQGMSAAAREALRSDSDRLLGTATDAILRGGGSPNAIGSVAAGVQNNLNQMAVYEDNARIANLARLQAARARMSANMDKSYQINQYAPWANRAQAIAQQQQGAQNMFMSGMNTLGQGIMGLAGTVGAAGKTPNSVPYRAPVAPMSSLPMTGISSSPAYTPQMVDMPPYHPYPVGVEAMGQPFGMMNENINNTPVFDGVTWR